MDEQENEPIQPVKRQAARITHHEIKAMKAVEAKKPPFYIALFNKVKAALVDLSSSFMSLFAGKQTSPCDINGHVFPKGTWEGTFPRCTHCGKEIQSADEMGTR
ncbi:MAG: hypothetical protein KGS72_17970 [Cyanobacteria bacterium REEB67]|nr:hypothetical protein [Cyanobacteria bacterium REEB67]